MLTPFVRVDLSGDARGFRHVVLQPGLPMLDRSSSNSSLLRQWLGRLCAEANWDGQTVVFYVQDDNGTLLKTADCRPATIADLRGPLPKELESLQEKLQAASPQTAKKAAFHRIVSSRSCSAPRRRQRRWRQLRRGIWRVGTT